MTAPVPGLVAADGSSAEALLGALKHVPAPELRKHATVYNYWLSIRRDREVPPIRDLDPLEISDVAPFSVLLELINGGEDAEIRHFGAALKSDVEIDRIIEAPQPSALSSIAGKLGSVAQSRDALAFEDTFTAGDGLSRCSVTLLPFSTTGNEVDFVYGLVSIETGVTEADETPEPIVPDAEPAEEGEPEPEILAEDSPEEVGATIDGEIEAVEADEPVTDQSPAQTVAEDAEPAWQEAEEEPEPFEAPASPTAAKPGFSSKVFDALAGAKGFFGTTATAEPALAPQPAAEEEPQPATEELEPLELEQTPPQGELGPVVELAALDVEEPEPVMEEPEPVAELTQHVIEEPVAEAFEPADPEPVKSSHFPMEGTLHSKLEQVRGMAEEAQAAKQRAEAALVDGLSAAYDFALDAEDAPEEYLKLVEAQGLKIQLRAPMAPVVKLAFNGSCDESTIKQLEAVLAWALKQELPRGSLGERIAEEGGIGSILSARAA